jgi:mannan endo-1,4-beta-mannosidase
MLILEVSYLKKNKKMKRPFVFIIMLPLFLTNCNKAIESINLVDEKATQETVLLYKNLKKNSKTGFMFGHQDAFSYGMGWNYEQEPGRCDVYEVVGDYPGIFGWDIGHLEVGSDVNIDSVNFESLKSNIVKAHELGAVNTISWHPYNPVTGGSTWDKSRTVAHILPGGDYHEKYKTWLTTIGEYMKSIKTDDGIQVPIVWRPYHEHNGGWFWWGEDSTSVQEYIDLWQYTVHFFKDTLNIHNLLWAYSPNLYESREEYLKKYPGDAYVDILGCDVYDLPQYNIDYKVVAQKNIAILKELGREKNKVYAFTETGFSGLNNEKWWTESLLPAIDTSGAAWMLVWRNARLDHFYAPYPGQKSEADFIDFYNLPQTLFASDVKKLNEK